MVAGQLHTPAVGMQLKHMYRMKPKKCREYLIEYMYGCVQVVMDTYVSVSIVPSSCLSVCPSVCLCVSLSCSQWATKVKNFVGFSLKPLRSGVMA